MLKVNYGGAGRKIPVPPILQLPNRSPALIVLETRLNNAAVECCESSWRGIKGSYLAQPRAADWAPGYEGLSDELSRYLPAATRELDPGHALKRSRAEYRAVRKLALKGGIDDLQATGGLTGLLMRIHTEIGAAGRGFRQGPIFIRPDSAGNVVEFPPHETCERLIHTLEEFLYGNLAEYPATCAVVGMVGVVHAHPFVDGNGRTARTLFNILLAAGCGSSHFLPIALIAFLSHGGFILKLRRAMLGGDWEKLVLFFVDALRLSDRLQRSVTDGPNVAG